MKSTLFFFATAALALLASAGPNRKCVVKHNGVDDSANIMDALEKCKDGGRVVFQKKRNYVLGDVIVSPELNNVEIIFEGTLTYPYDMKYNDTTPPVPGAVQDMSSFFLIKGKDVKVTGDGGEIYGNGEHWWSLDPLPSNRPSMMAFMVENLDVRGVRLINAPNWNFYIHETKNALFEDIYINDVDQLYGEKPHNTDGWGMSETHGITIKNSYINNGDDCVAIKTNSSDIHIENLYCNGSHGISVGSLGNIPELPDYVENLYVKNVTCENCQNGARIKTWARGALGRVENVSYIDFRVTNSDHPIAIDQCYFNIKEPECSNDPSLIQIKNVLFQNVTGNANSKAGLEVASIKCSAEAPCDNFVFKDVDIKTSDPSQEGYYTCAHIENSDLSGINCVPPK
ncbi:hypothetical protein O0I10_005746 [Lichtheimia ornata]|uniref:Glycoside hydrolase family 28 protein n=1 Tax=Lichtheimia ornata TaxID=688661 RepID=A0AAD7V3V4_9FUNG|nr:uncharacterized protein O0I10_005746 [Lichtheimia ornata]KAJ8658394.1 hypothetical protein O0I10_005746 [Lichtheimia ornata]